MSKSVSHFTHNRSDFKMIPTWAVLLLCVIGASCFENEHIGKLPHRPRPRPSLDIFNGKNTSVAEYPYIASVVHSGQQFGAAVILNKHWLLSSGYSVSWVSIDELQFRVGSNFYDKQGQVLKASKIIAHPNYTGSWDWDIAVIKTDKPIKLGKNVKPVKLGTKKLMGGTKAWVAGWGEYDSTETPSKNLLKGQVTVYDWKKCEAIYSSALTQRLMCTLDKKVSPCIYDFGDPMVKKGVLYGLFAGGYGCAPNANPVLYTDVPSLYKWVQITIKSEEDDQE